MCTYINIINVIPIYSRINCNFAIPNLKVNSKKKNAQIKIIFYTADVAIPLNFFISVISFAEATL